MANALSVDPRERVVAAVTVGLSRWAAAAHFGVSVSSAVRWVELGRYSGGVTPKPRGGDQRSARIEAQRR
jgi:transposase